MRQKLSLHQNIKNKKKSYLWPLHTRYTMKLHAKLELCVSHIWKLFQQPYTQYIMWNTQFIHTTIIIYSISLFFGLKACALWNLRNERLLITQKIQKSNANKTILERTCTGGKKRDQNNKLESVHRCIVRAHIYSYTHSLSPTHTHTHTHIYINRSCTHPYYTVQYIRQMFQFKFNDNSHYALKYILYLTSAL